MSEFSGEALRREVSILIERLRSDKVKDRNRALSDLRRLFHGNRHNINLDGLELKQDYIPLLRTIFQVTSNESSALMKITKASSKQQTLTRLSSCSSVFRVIVEAGVRKFRSRTVKSLVNHILRFISFMHGTEGESLGLDYARCLRVLLEYQPHVEHLSKEDWMALVDFCVENLGIESEDQSFSPSPRGSGIMSPQSAPQTPNDPSVTPDSRTARRRLNPGPSPETEQYIACIRQLVRAPNAPISHRSKDLLVMLLSYIWQYMSMETTLHVAFSALNSILSCIVTESISLAKQAVGKMLPVVTKLWHTKSRFLRAEMLKSLLLLRCPLRSMVNREYNIQMLDDLQTLLEIIQSDYSKRPERDQLLLEEICLARNSIQAPLSINTFQLKPGVKNAEQNWLEVDTIAFFMDLLTGVKETDRMEDRIFMTPKKRQRKIVWFEELLRQAKYSQPSSRIAALQIVCFLRDPLPGEKLQFALKQLVPVLVDDNGTVASWAMLAVSSWCFEANTAVLSCKSTWLQIWQIASRNVTAISTSRASCHLLWALLANNILSLDDVSENMKSMLSSIELSGPGLCCDSSIALWTSFVHLKNRNNIQDRMVSEHVVRWFFSKWTPEKLSDRLYVTSSSAYTEPAPIFNLLLECTGRQNLVFNPVYFPTCGDLGASSLQASKDYHLNSFLYLLPEIDHQLYNLGVQDEVFPEQIQLHSNDHIIIGYLTSIMTKAQQALTEIAGDKSFYLSHDVIRMAFSLLMVSCAFASASKSSENEEIFTLNHDFQQLIFELLATSENHDFIDVLVELAGSVLGPSFQENDGPLKKYILMVSGNITRLVANQREQSSSFSFCDPIDSMDVDESSKTQATSISVSDQCFDYPRKLVDLETDINSFRQSAIFKINMFAKIGSLSWDMSGSTFVDCLNYLKAHEILYSRDVIIQLTARKRWLTRDNARQILGQLSEKLLDNYEYDGCEVSICMCAEVMKNMTDLWADGSGDDLCALAEQLYEWFVNTLSSTKRMSSPNIQITFTGLLQRLLKNGGTFAPSLQLPSPRTILFNIVRDGNANVKYHVTDAIVQLFSLYVLKEHDAILDDALESLPSEPDWEEGIILRLFVLARLASKWHTLLRKCVYHIFEIPANIPEMAPHATRCLAEVSHSIHLSNSQQLFRMFSPQILYTWLEKQPLLSIPYSIFGYGSLRDMLIDVQDEVTGQIVMRTNETDAETLATIFDIPFNRLLLRCFDKALAYSISRDISIPPSSESNAAGAELWIRKRVGNVTFARLTVERFVNCVTIMFRSMDQEEQFGKALAKRSRYSFAAENLRRMNDFGSADISLPLNQQPSFRAKYITDQLEHLCKRADYNVGSLWTQPMIIYVFRNLMDSIHPALGPLYACSVIRRIRILISLVDKGAFEDYPIEMMIHALRPFLTNAYCASDTIGIVKYLFTYGQVYLLKVPSFVLGIGLSTLLSIQSFLRSEPDSTTQETHHLQTLQKVKEFHFWLGNYLEQYDSYGIKEGLKKTFTSLVRSAREAQHHGNSFQGTGEAELLRGILEDRKSGRLLLHPTYSELLLTLLCENFQVAPDFRRDILGDDQQSQEFCSIVWLSCQNSSQNFNYQLWVARVLGRAFASSGKLDSKLLRETNLDNLCCNQDATNDISIPEASIIKILEEELLSDDPYAVGQTEYTLQNIMTRLIETKRDCTKYIPSSLSGSLTWDPYCPPSSIQGHLALSSSVLSLRGILDQVSVLSAQKFIQAFCCTLISFWPKDAVVGPLEHVMKTVSGTAERIFPCLLHYVLSIGSDKFRGPISEIFQRVIRKCDELRPELAKAFINAILYLRSQPILHEKVKSTRDDWLELDYEEAATAAVKCKFYKTGLLFLEIYQCQVAHLAPRSTVNLEPQMRQLLLSVFKSIDEPDSFYGVSEQSGLRSVMDRLDYEETGFERLLFQSAFLDSQLRSQQLDTEAQTLGTVKALNSLNMNGLAQALLLNRQQVNSVYGSREHLQAAISLQQWNINVPSMPKFESNTMFRAFQALNNSNDLTFFSESVNACMLEAMKRLKSSNRTSSSIHATLRTLAMLVEMDEIVTSNNMSEFVEARARMTSRCSWMDLGDFKDVQAIMMSRENLLCSLPKRKYLLNSMHISEAEAQEQEIRALLASSRLSRNHGSLQSSLRTASYLSLLVDSCNKSGITIDAAVQRETANVLWDQSEMAASIRMLRNLKPDSNLPNYTIPVSRPELLATLGHHVAEARLEKPDEIIAKYLTPAIKELRDQIHSEDAGQVFHQFGSFCDLQLQNTENKEDFERVRELRKRKEDEVRELEGMLQTSQAKGREKEMLKGHFARAKQWFELDNREYQRLQQARQAFLRQSLENYLLCLQSCDKYDSDVLRFCALWLAQSDIAIANEAVSKHLGHVASQKFVPLMNQLSSRLLDCRDSFQSLLFGLVVRICVDHPYHGMYQVFASSKTKGSKDDTALSRNHAATNVAHHLSHSKSKKCRETWIAIHNSNCNYVKFALDKPNSSKFRAGAKLRLHDLTTGRKLAEESVTRTIPPPTIKIEIRADCDYHCVPVLAKFLPSFSIASGVSSPKIITLLASDGSTHKQLLKGGNDDLRQDSIMEQVFEQVSRLLQTHRSTRQRNLQIRTYKVLPLTANAGIIEFVPNTIPLHEYLLPAHQEHFPKDLKPNSCRKQIADVQSGSVDARVKTFKHVTTHFHPVMRYFFMERFNHPNDWFERRLAYTRTTAAISILGYVLGLGDRHGHNILLDEMTGEVVHIDLGVAFEQGRVLPVPEVVPFRLTRDLVDGMGITKTEGVFRRCCEFTLDALRQESYSIMTILDVLRYDPLYSWSVSPLRLKRMQEAQNQNGNQIQGDAANLVLPDMEKPTDDNRKTLVNEPSEADRALAVVSKKLGKSLSVTATVNELIQQATDERNLAVLYCGWAAYA